MDVPFELTSNSLFAAIRGEGTDGVGVRGSSTNSHGVNGSSLNSIGVRGDSTSGTGVRGSSTDSYGVRGVSTNGIGLYGGSSNDHAASFVSQRSEVKFGEGGFLASTSFSQGILSGGAFWNGSQWIATASGAAVIATSSGTVSLYTNTGLSSGSSFSLDRTFFSGHERRCHN